jgi:periplasmic copper chaperone A
VVGAFSIARTLMGTRVRTKNLSIGLLAMLLLVQVAADASPAAEYTAGKLVIAQPWSRPTPPVATTGVVYLSITNRGSKADRLLALSTAVARSVEIHETRTVDGMVEMRQLAAVNCPPNATVVFEAGGMHIMVVGLSQPLAAGTDFPLTLRFQEAGAVTVQVHVRERE